MHHPLLDLVATDDAEAAEVEDALGALESLGWSPRAVGVALSEAKKLAGRASANKPLIVVVSDDQPSVAVRLPVNLAPRAAAELNWLLYERLTAQELNRPGFSVSFLAEQPEREVQRRA